MTTPIAQAAASADTISTFYYFATALSVGIVAMLPLVPIRQIGRKFFILLTLVAVVFYALAIGAHGLSIEWTHGCCGVLLILYNIFVSEKGGWLSLALLVSALGFGIAGLVSDARALPLDLPTSVDQSVVVAASFIASSLVLGGALVSMVLGHWYLVAKGLSFDVLGRVVTVLLAAFVLRAAVIAWVAWTQGEHWAQLWTDSGGAAAFFLSQGMYIGARALFGILVPIVLAVMAWRCVKIRSNQSATGILYVIVAFVLLGEALAKHLLIANRILV